MTKKKTVIETGLLFGLLEPHRLVPRPCRVDRVSRALGPSAIARGGLGASSRSAQGVTSPSAARQ